MTLEWESELGTNLQLEFDLELTPILDLYTFSFFIVEKKLFFNLINWLGTLNMESELGINLQLEFDLELTPILVLYRIPFLIVEKNYVF